MLINYGCGRHAPDGWLNFDASPTLRIERLPIIGLAFRNNRFPANVRFGDIVRGLPVPDGSVKAVYASHILEHLALEDFRAALQNTYRMMAPGGTFRLIVPDLQAQIATYVEHTGMGKRDANDFFLRTTFLGQEHRPKTLGQHVRAMLGNSEHKWMWDWPSIEDQLIEAGFVSVRRCAYGDSAEPAFKTIEIADRYQWSVAAEAVK